MRIGIALLAVMWASPLMAQTSLQAPNGTNFQIQDRHGGDLTAPAVFRAWPKLCVRSCADCSTPCAAGDVYDAGGQLAVVEANERQLSMATVNLAGLQVRRKIYVPAAGQATANGYVRYLDLLTNPTGGAITVAVRIGSAGAGNGQLDPSASQVWRTSNDDAELEITDRWVITDDNNSNGGIGSVAHIVHGAGSRSRPASLDFAYGAGALSWDFRQVQVPAGSTVAFMTVLVYEASRENAIAEAVNLLGVNEVDLLDGLTDAERRAVLNFDLDPNNATPIAQAGGPYSADEGVLVGLTAAGTTDPDVDDDLSYAWDLDDDGAYDDAVGFNAEIMYPDDGSYVVGLRVTDAAGKSDTDVAHITIVNRPPHVRASDSNSPIDEGGLLTINLDVADIPADPVVYDIDWDGDGQFEEPNAVPEINGQGLAEFQHRYPSDGVFSAQVRLSDDDGGVTLHNFEVIVRNVAPQIFQIVAPPTVAEGAEVNVSVVAQDAGGDPITFAYDFETDGIIDAEGVGLDEVTHTYFQDGVHTLTVFTTDAQGAQSSREKAVSVGNLRPDIVGAVNDSPMTQGSPVRIDVTATDPGRDPLSYSFDLNNDGAFEDDVVDIDDPFLVHIFNTPGVQIVGVRVRDDGNLFSLTSTEVTIENGAPSVDLQGPPNNFVNQGEPFDIVAVATDPGGDALRYDFDLTGDGQFDLVGVEAHEQIAVLNREGLHNLRVRVHDPYGATAEDVLEIRIGNQVPSLAIEVTTPQAEGAEVVINSHAEDPGGDDLTLSYDMDNDGVFEIEDTPERIVRWRYPDEGRYTVRVVVTDSASIVDDFAFVEITNAPPALEVTSNAPLNEGDVLTLTITVVDPGDDTVTVSCDLDGDGVADESVDIAEDNVPYTLEGVVPDDLRFLAVCTADDGDGGAAEAQSTVVVNNVAPSFVVIDQQPAAVEGEPYNFVVPAEDPGLQDQLTFALLDPPPGVEIRPQSGLIDWIPTYQQFLASPMSITVRVSDPDGGSAETQFEVEVLARDEDLDGIPDSYEEITCSAEGVCLDPTDPGDAREDPDADGMTSFEEWQAGQDPFHYEGPETPMLIAPADSARVNTRTPEMVVSWVASTLNDPVTIEYEIYADVLLTQLAFSTDVVSQAEEGPTSWAPPVGILLEDNFYWWRVRAIAGVARSPWTPAWSYRTNETNQAPPPPEMVLPSDGTTVDTVRPTLSVRPSVDPDGDTLTYNFRVYQGTGVDAAAFHNGAGHERGEFIEHTPTTDLIENAEMSWDVVAIDAAGAVSAPSERFSFTINVSNDAPGAPEIIYPEAGIFVDSLTPTFISGRAVDFDDAQLDYTFRVLDKRGEDTIEIGPAVAAVENIAEWVPEALDEDTWYRLEVFVNDGEADSPATQARFFVSTVDNPPSAPVLTNPADGATVKLRDAVTIWAASEDPEESEVQYVVHYCRSGNCNSLPQQGHSSLNMETMLDPGETVEWWVEAFDEDGEGQSSGLSEHWHFIVEGGASSDDGGGCSATGRQPSAPHVLMLFVLGLGGILVARRRRA